MGFGFGSKKRRIEETRRNRREEKRRKKLDKSRAPVPGEQPLFSAPAEFSAETQDLPVQPI